MRETKGGFLIGQIKQIQARVFNVLLQCAGVDEFNGAQGRILYVLWQQDDVMISQLAEKTGLTKTTLTSMLNRMESKGMIQKVPGKDQRQTRIILAKKAKELSKKYEEVSNEMNEIFYRGFDDDEITLFESMLERILDNLKERERNE